MSLPKLLTTGLVIQIIHIIDDTPTTGLVIQIFHVIAETLTTGLVIPLWTNSPPAEASIH